MILHPPFWMSQKKESGFEQQINRIFITLQRNLSKNVKKGSAFGRKTLPSCQWLYYKTIHGGISFNRQSIFLYDTVPLA